MATTICVRHILRPSRATTFRVLRAYSNQGAPSSSAVPTRKQITIVSDDGRVQWGALSTREKVTRTAQKTFHLGIVLTGLVMTVCADGGGLGTGLTHEEEWGCLLALHGCLLN
jgi:hypothetical protein